jgi:peptidoglycan hydrolase-like protein with peptidoglycan-binding domain
MGVHHRSHLTPQDRHGNTVIDHALAKGPVAPGANVEAVRWLERMLKLAGFNPGTPDKKFGPATEKALSQFQASVGLPATGTLDKATFKKLEAVEERVRAHAKDGFVGVGQKRGDVLAAEKNLRALGYDVGAVDGVYDGKLAGAVKAFKADQKELKNGPGGSFGKPVKRALAREVRELQHGPEHVRVKPSRVHRRLDAATVQAAAKQNSDGTVGLGLGAKGRAVSNLEAHLRGAGYDPGAQNGALDERTAAALRAFQRHASLPATGRLDTATWAKLKQAFLYAKNGTSPAQGLGERSRAVLHTEKELKKLGYHLKADGLFDKATARAVASFKHKHHLSGTAEVGAGTAKALARAVKAADTSHAGQAAIHIAHRWLGFQERGTNGNPFSAYFHRPPEAWCADFVSYCFEKAGHPIGQKGVGYCSVASMAGWFQGRGHWHSKPKVGAIITFDWPTEAGRYNHVGIVTRVANGRVYTIEGNSSDGVHERSYPIGSSVISGYGWY